MARSPLSVVCRTIQVKTSAFFQFMSCRSSAIEGCRHPDIHHRPTDRSRVKPSKAKRPTASSARVVRPWPCRWLCRGSIHEDMKSSFCIYIISGWSIFLDQKNIEKTIAGTTLKLLSCEGRPAGVGLGGPVGKR